jgi:Peptidase family M23
MGFLGMTPSDPGRSRRRLHRPLVPVLAALMLVGGIIQTAPPASASVVSPVACNHPVPPSWFHRELVEAIAISRDLPASWARSPAIAQIVCWQGTGFRPRFSARRVGHRWHGIFAMTVPEMQTMFGPWMTATRDAFHLSSPCFVLGWAACPRTAGNRMIIQQIIAGLRWIWLNYGSPGTAWEFIQRTGRFNSYPRRGTNDAPARSPLALCPVEGSVSYQDDFGEVRTVGGYHPHWGNDIVAPTGRPIRAPFDGLAVAHSDNWFAGNWVTVTGERGYVRNGHMSAFARLGFVKAGTVIGYVGSTGDARGPHDHFEWHPWAAPAHPHRAPSGFTRIMDGIDPYPYLNAACGAARVATFRKVPTSE